nr:reverse transcriptase domain-containing protein [Tanacetum cinerariifolium]
LHTWPRRATDTTSTVDEDEHEPMFIQPHDLDFVPEPIYPKYIPLEDEHILPAKEQPLPSVVSPTAESPGYVTESDPEEDPEEYEDDETKDGPVDYLMDGGDDDDGDSSRDDADDEDEEEEDEEEDEEEHLALADSAVVIPTDELAVISFPPEAEVERLLAMPTPSPSPLISLSPPSVGERLARCTALAALPSPPLPPHLHMPPPVDRKDDIPKTEMPPCKRLCLSTLGSRYEVGESSTARPTRGQGIDYRFVSTLDAEARRRGIGEVRYGIKDTWIDLTEIVPETAHMTVGEVNTRVTELAELHEHDTQDLDALLKDALDSRTRISQRVVVDSQRAQMAETLRVMGDMRREMGDMQTELLALREQPRRAGQPGGDARVFNHQDAPRDADRTKGAVGLTRWIEKMESVFQISGCAVENQEVLKKKITDKYCPQGEIKKLEIELWNLKVKENNVSAYTERFQELTLICTKFVADETEKIDKPPKDKMSPGFTIWGQRNNRANPKGNGCSECGDTGHFKRDCPKLKNKDGEGSFISTAFNSLIDIVSTPLGNSYDVELADGNIVRVDTIMRGCTLNFLGHPFNIDLMPIELGSFDVIIGMDSLRRCHAVIVCDEKLVQIPYGNETLTFCGNESNNERESRLTVISCSKAQEYMEKGC